MTSSKVGALRRFLWYADEVPPPSNTFAQRITAQRGEKRRWANLRHVNGVAVYQEDAEQSGEGGAFMVSAVVRSTPKACFQVRINSLFIDNDVLVKIYIHKIYNTFYTTVS